MMTKVYLNKPSDTDKVKRIAHPDIRATRVYINHHYQRYPIALYASRVSAGRPSVADDYIERYIELSPEVVKDPATTFLVIASGDSMINAGIDSGDMLVVDKQREASNGKVIIAAVDGELTVKRLSLKPGAVALLPENPCYQPIDIKPEQSFVIWGVVTYRLNTKDHSYYPIL